MIRKITGTLTGLELQAAHIEVGGLEYEVLIPECVRRQLQPRVGEKVSLATIEYLDGNPQRGRLTPRIVGFLHDAEKQFFDLICQVDGLGVKKALQAMVRPVREIATAIEEQDVKTLATLPGIGAAGAERIVAKLRRKMTRYALMVSKSEPYEVVTSNSITQEAYEALMALGHTAVDAKNKIEHASEDSKGKFKSVEELLQVIYRQQRPGSK